MYSLYIHIPFCQKKCGYCSFPVLPLEKIQEPQGMADSYKSALFRDIEYWAKRMSNTIGFENKNMYYKPLLSTIYFGGGTPLMMGSQYLIDIIDECKKHFDTTQLLELSIECNPYPYQQTLSHVKHIIDTYQHIFPRIRFSFGIQSLDDAILQSSGRDCTFLGLQEFTKKLIDSKPSTGVLYNYDFISFGARKSDDTTKTILSQEAYTRLDTLIHQKEIDSFSLYTLELFPGAKRYHETKDPLIAYQAPRDHHIPFDASEDSILQEFAFLKSLFLQGGYERYEISNYAIPGKESIHNQTYWNMKSYIGIGLGAHGFISIESNKKPSTIADIADNQVSYNNHLSYRTEAGGGRKNYITLSPHEIYKHTTLDEKDILIEGFFLGLRTKHGIDNLQAYKSILIDERESAVYRLVTEGLVVYKNNHLQLTDTGMDVHHRICTFLMKDI